MSLIVCATRGGEGSRAVQQKALDVALAEQANIVFLYIIDVARWTDVEEGLEGAAKDEAYWLGKTLLYLAKLRAEAVGISAEIEIREGDMLTTIQNYVRDRQASHLLLGAPRGTTANVFGDDAIEQFAGTIAQETGIPAEVVRPEST